MNYPGNQSSPSIGGQWIAFSRLAPAATSHDIFVYNIATNNLYQVSSTTGDNQLNDITVNTDGTVRVAWQVQQTSLAVYAFSFRPSVEFAAFSGKGGYHFGIQRVFTVNSTFTLGTGGSFNLATDAVTVQLQSAASITIPAGSFTQTPQGKFVLSAVINGVAVDANLPPLGGSSYSLKVDAAGVAKPAQLQSRDRWAHDRQQHGQPLRHGRLPVITVR